jgi:hypothetical protein
MAGGLGPGTMGNIFGVALLYVSGVAGPAELPPAAKRYYHGAALGHMTRPNHMICCICPCAGAGPAPLGIGGDRNR